MGHLAAWICNHYPYSEPLTHLKLQKLFFYCYGALLAADLEHELGSTIEFEAWDHGPVNRDLYRMFRSKGAGPIVPQDFSVEEGKYSPSARFALKDALTVYGAMSAWSLRQQSHLEDPWKEAFEKKEAEINSKRLKRFFKSKWATGSVASPEHLFGLSSFRIDGIPVQNYSSLHELARAVERVVKTKA